MKQADEKAIRQEIELLTVLLRIHTQGVDFWDNDAKGLEDHVNAILDRINELKAKLKNIDDDEKI